jgi:hypothetical protein
MHAMQYEITLPADYDMAVIRHRVATRGPRTDDFPGLGLKAYLIRERDVDGAPVNQYAPLYLWADVRGMNRFLYGGAGFGGIVADFGRPAVRHWTGVGFAPGPARSTAPTVATRPTERVPDDADPAALVNRALAELDRRASVPGVHSVALAVDPRHWELVRVTLWEQPDAQADGCRYQLLHLSTPHLADIDVGRHWS